MATSLQAQKQRIPAALLTLLGNIFYRNTIQFHKFSSKIVHFPKKSSAPQFHKISSKFDNFQIRSAPQFHQVSPSFINFHRELSSFKKRMQIFDAHSQHASFGKAFEPTGFPRVPLANATALTIV